MEGHIQITERDAMILLHETTPKSLSSMNLRWN